MFADGDAARPWHRFSHDFALPLPVGDAELPHLCRGIAAINFPLGMMCSPSFFIIIFILFFIAIIDVSVFTIIVIIAIVVVIIVFIAIDSIIVIIGIVI